MNERKVWTKEEDDVLKHIYEVRKIKKWSSVARCMEAQFQMTDRTGKQCRQRWYNQLSPDIISKKQWTGQEERELFLLHEKIGNRWAEIAKKLNGRTDNSVKNHFYSTLRRGMRKLNKFITESKKDLRLLNNVLLSKIINVADDIFEQKKMQDVSDGLRNQSCDVVRGLIELSCETYEPEVKDHLEECLAKKVWSFSRNYTKKRPKKKKKNCKLDDEESVHTGQSNEEIIPKPKKRQSRRTLFGVEVEKSENHEEEAPIDFLVNLMIGNVSITKVPSSPVFLENSMNIGLIGSFKLPFPFDVEIPFACQRGVSLDSSYNGGIPNCSAIWQNTARENFEMVKVEDSLHN